MPTNACVYSSLFGSYYRSLPPMPTQGIDAICFTDDVTLSADGWSMRVIQRDDATPRLRAKYFKMMPHECLPEYDVSIWLDANWQVMSNDFAREALAYLDGTSITLYPHRWRDCVKDELLASVHPKYAFHRLTQQVHYYFESGYPDTLGLFECTMLMRRHHSTDVIALDDEWWLQCRQWSEADQLSLPYVLWKLNTPYATLPFNLDQQPWIRSREWRRD